MHFSQELIAFLAATLFSSSTASPIDPTAPLARIDCNDPKTGVHPACWTSLKVGDYMTSWQQKNRPDHCKEGEPWSVCFDRLATSNPKQDCTGIDSKMCEEFDSKFHYLSPQWFYGAYNTWSINQFFTAWSNAIKYIGKNNPTTINIAAQPQDFDAFRAAHATTQVSIDTALKNLITLAPKNLQNDALYAVLETFKSFTTYDSSKIDTADPPVVDLLQIRLEQVLKHVETDVPTFVAFAAKGAFSTADITTSATLTKALWPENGAVGSIEG